MAEIDEGLIVTAIAELGSEDAQRRKHAREALERAGKPATWHLIQALGQTDERVRRGALEALVASADPAAADAFVERLEDEDASCRWQAAEGLVALGRAGLRRALGLATDYPKNEAIRRGVHHVLHAHEQDELGPLVRPVLATFDSKIPEIELPAAARTALDELKRK